MKMSTPRYCILVPNYNCQQGFEALVQKLLINQLPIIVINDGSDVATHDLLSDIEAKYPLLSVIHHHSNQGKGAAVLTGFECAFEQGFTHALQIDADGQHNSDDIPLFIELSRDAPESIISGCPEYDESVPAARKYGRYLTHVWVYIETLSLAIKDSMCGFRVYPLDAMIDINTRHPLGKRMDFDIEILVRAHWRGIAIVSQSTRVVYPEGGTSNFRIWRDNWLISKMHARLFLGMLIRLPALLYRKLFPGKKKKHWASIQEKGSVVGMKTLVWIYQHLGRIPFQIFLHPVLLYFVLTASTARQSSRHYLKQLARYKSSGNPPENVGWLSIYKHFYHFADSALDKIACWSDAIKRSDVVVHDEASFSEVLQSGKGAIFIGSHLGNLEVCRALGEKGGRFRINALVFNKNAAKFHQVLSENNPEVNLNLIHVESIGADTAILLKQKVDEGEIVIIVGDRTPVNNAGRVQEISFLGKPAPFSEGPFILAAVLECPVYLLFCLKESGHYNIYLERFADSLKFPRAGRKEKLLEKMQEYVNRLSSHCGRVPYEWFNFYDFWADGMKDGSDGNREAKDEVIGEAMGQAMVKETCEEKPVQQS